MAQTITLDFSQSHSIDDLTKSGLQINAISGGLKGQAYTFQNQAIRIILPAGRSFDISIHRGLIDTDNTNLLRFSTTGSVMPTDQAKKVAVLFHDAFNILKDTLDEWYENNRNVRFAVGSYNVSPLVRYYPAVTLSISPSMNDVYPWVSRFTINWNWRPHHDWDEERAWRELTEPPVELAHISLNPPSGKLYDRKSAYSWWNNLKRRFQ